MNTYPLGSHPKVSAFFEDADGPADPTTVTASVTDPDGVVTAYVAADFDNPAVGTWTLDLTADVVGTWSYTVTGTGGVDQTRPGSFRVASLEPLDAAGPCSLWAQPADLRCDTLTDEAEQIEALEVASEILWNLTGRQWPGTCSDHVRPCGYRTARRWGHSPWQMSNRHILTGWCGCRASRGCGCGGLSDIELPGQPVVSVDEVKIDGVVVDPANYRVDDHRWLTWVGEADDGRKAWPCCSRLDVGDDEEDTFSVWYSFGAMPPRGGRRYAARLACQLGLAAAGDSDCELPERVTSIVRQGITLAVLDPLDLFEDGRTGLSDVDLWLGSLKAGVANRAGTVRMPGRGPMVRRPG